MEHLVEAFQEVPQAYARLGVAPANQGHGDDGVDAMMEVEVAGKPVRVLIQAKMSAYPRDVREFLWQAKRYDQVTGMSGNATVTLLLAEALSPGAKAMLKSEGVGYCDSGGSLFLPVPGAYIYVDRPPPKKAAQTFTSVYQGKRAQILHALLIHPKTWFGVHTLAGMAKVSPAMASETLVALERLDWVSSRGSGPTKQRCLVNPRAALDGWAVHVSGAPLPVTNRYFVNLRTAEQLVNQIAEVFNEHQVDYAITHEAAAQRYAPYLSSLSQVRCRLHGGKAAEQALHALKARPVKEGANLVVVPAHSDGELLFRQQVDSAWLASPIQVYLDLVGAAGRAKEMAEHLRQTRIGF